MNISRVKRIIGYMQAEGLEQIIVSAETSIYYLTGIRVHAGERMLALYLNTHGDILLFANRLFALSAGEGFELVEYDDTDDPVAILASRIHSGAIGIDKFWPSHFTIRLMQAKPGIVPVVGSGPVDHARMLKDEDEIALMRQSSLLNDEALRRTYACLKEGMTELDLAAAYAQNAKDAGGQGNSFTPITCFGANCAEPHHDNDETTLKKGNGVILDVGLVYNGYCSDMTRTVFFGSVTDEQKKIYDICRRANEEGRKAVRPGVEMCMFDRAARKVIEDAGYGKYFIHRTGHGIGLEVHEHPDNSATSHIIAEPGMCFSVEPGIYLPGYFGVRIEDLVCVTENGCETLNHLDHELTVL